MVVPTFECGPYLATAVASVRMQAGDVCGHPEIIIVDDGSTDDTAEVINRLGGDLNVLRQANAGPSAARNTGIAAAGGELICLLDADDALAPGALAKHCRRLEADPELDVSQGRTQFARRLAVVDGAIDAELEGSPELTMNVGSCLFRRTAFATVGLFDETLHNFEDHDWFLRARHENVTILVDDEVSLYRLRRDGGQSQRPLDELRQPAMRLVRESLARRRRAESRDGSSRRNDDTT